MKVLLGVISPVAAWNIPRALVDRIRCDFPEHTFLEAWDRASIRRLLPEADAAFTPLVDRDVLPHAQQLRWVQCPAVGVSHLLYPEMVRSHVVITNARGVRARAIAEHVLGVTIALARRFHTAIRHQVAHEWSQDPLENDPVHPIRTLYGCRLGIVGLGSIGMEIAKVCAAFGFRVSAIRRRVEIAAPDYVDELLPPGRLHELLARSDVVVLAAPLTPETRAMIGSRELSTMKRDALLVNIGRGALVDDEALIDALMNGRLAGAALDVFTEEPLERSSRYWDLPNVLVTPHTSGALQDYWTPLVDLFANNLRRFEGGQPMLNVVDKQAGY